jgi:beta-glucosidase/6-phospho-beta-glucosidase/beta-galactosidase
MSPLDVGTGRPPQAATHGRPHAEAAEAASPPELWGGVECSVVRVGAGWRDQVVETGHHGRAGDLDLIAAAGIRTLRYPVLWERVAPDQPDRCDWRWCDERLGRLRDLGIAPVVGLVHHGSGPRYTDLLDPGFAAGLAAHAAHAAVRYPWVEAWTPANEPLTTARFSGLYGHWYPHRRDEASMLHMVANQCRAVLLAMRAIRRAIPLARLVQTEDIGRVFSTARLAYQAEYENGRRWLSLDLLCGRVDRSHPWRPRLLAAGVPARHLDELATGEAAPDVIGVNHYVTSDRFLDHRTGLYPLHVRGGNGRDSYADTAAVHMDLPAAATGWAARLDEVWRRYRRPLAITEAHLGDEPEEQVRWLMEAWEAAVALRRAGADLRAVTAWALFGLVDWDCLLCRSRGRHEPGAWDARGGADGGPPPHPTPLAEAVAALAQGRAFAHPCLDTPGWWRRDERLHPGAAVAPAAQLA